MAPQQRNPVLNEDGNTGMRRVDSEASDMSELGNDTRAQDYRIRKSSLIGMIDWGHVMVSHLPLLMVVGILTLVAQIVHQVVIELGLQNIDWSVQTVSTICHAIKELFRDLYASIMESRGFDLFSPAVKTTALLLFLGAWWMRRKSPVYLLSFATFKAPDSWKMSHAQIVEIMRRQGCFSEDSLEFMGKILARSGTGQATAWPPGITHCLQDENTKADRSIEAARREAEIVIFDIVEKALQKARVRPQDIDILIINCSLFSPTPSLCAMVLSHFGMRSDVATFNLSGMGCSASLISIDLAKSLLGTRPNSKALVVSTEIITPALYHGSDRGFLIQNTLFRCGGAAMVLSNSWYDGRRAWYKLLHTVRVQGTNEAAVSCVYETEDAQGHQGVRLSKDIVKVAGKCMEKNFTVLGPSVLPLTEQAKVVVSIAARFVLKKFEGYTKRKVPSIRPYVPDFKRGIDHFCIHAGGRAVIDGIEKNMQLQMYHTEASRMTLLNYGNTSSSSIWYELEYIQDQQKTNPLKKGDRVLQVAFGSGFKCTSGVWLKL
jgi:predicted naringenin-chalcone synthase